MLCTCLRQPQREPLLSRCPLPREAHWHGARQARKGTCRLEVRPVFIGRALELLRVARGVPRTCVRHEQWRAVRSGRLNRSRTVQGHWARTVFKVPGERNVVAPSARVASGQARPQGLLHHLGCRVKTFAAGKGEPRIVALVLAALIPHLQMFHEFGHPLKAAGLANRAVTIVRSRAAMTCTSSGEELAGLQNRGHRAANSLPTERAGLAVRAPRGEVEKARSDVSTLYRLCIDLVSALYRVSICIDLVSIHVSIQTGAILSGDKPSGSKALGTC